MDSKKLRAWWWAKQGLDGSVAKAGMGGILAKTGWARSVGGAGPYATLFARCGATGAELDQAAARMELYELPSARGCTYVLGAEDFAFGLECAQAVDKNAELKIAIKLGATEPEIAKLCDGVVRELEKGERTPEELREALGKLVRNFGPEGVKKGMATTLPVALGRLQLAGEIRRVPLNGRFDTQRYRYARWKPGPFAKKPRPAPEVMRELARRYFAWVGPATMEEFQGFAGIGVKAGKETVEGLGLVEAEQGSGRWLLPEDADRFAKFVMPKEARYSLLSSLDSLFLLRRDAAGLADDVDVPRLEGHLSELESNGIVDRGRLIGLWEFDPAAGEIVWASWGKADKALKEVVARTEAWARALGDVRSFSLDSPKSRKPRLDALRKAAG
ncbi:MAG: crosslink repair DNA glycosylase YcaQ family protein [Acidobacteriota bacterium]